MSYLDSLDERARVRLAREGGVAYMPALARPRDINFRECSRTQRQRVCQLLDEAERLQCTEQIGRGDQRYYRIVIMPAGEEGEEITLKVPEQQAPQPLVLLWKKGPVEDADERV